MDNINQAVTVNNFFFKRGKQLKAFPRCIELDNTRYTFNDGLQYLVCRGQQIIRLFDMTDGRVTYRLRLENDQWTLVGTRQLA